MEALTTLASAVAAEAIKNLAKDMSSFVTKKISEYYYDLTNKEMVDSGWAFEDYLSRTYNEFYKSKSILYTNEARALSSFFVPSFLKFKTEVQSGKVYSAKQNYSISGEDIDELLKDSTKIVIMGIGGLGKTMHMRHFCINAVEKKCKIPVFISLRAFNDCQIGEKSFEELVYDRLRIFRFKLKYEYFKYSLESDKYLFLLDGYDEISSSKRNQISTKLLDFTQRYSGNCFIISSRETEDVYSWDNFKIFSLCPLEHRQSVQLIWKLDFSYEIKMSFIDELNSKKLSKYGPFISVPLLLSILFLTYADNMIIPETLKDFYERAFDTMLYRHDRLEKRGFIRKLDSGLSYEEYRIIFVHLCFISYFKERYSFTERGLIDLIAIAAKKNNISLDSHMYKKDLVEATCMLYRDGLEYTFIHRSFQEYFAALYLSQKSDVQQNKFCTGFLERYHNPTMYENRYDFLRMLSAIEPTRFEQIILKPILSKINQVFVNHDRDYLDTLKFLYSIECSSEKDETNRCIVYIYENVIKEYGISVNSMRLFLSFKNEMKGRLECGDEVICNIFDNCQLSAYYSATWHSFEKRNKMVVFMTDLNYDIDNITIEPAVDELLLALIIGLKRYEELSSHEVNDNMEFDSMLYSL